MKSLPTLAIIIPTFKGGVEPIKCLESLKKLEYPKNKLEIIVINNGGNDDTSRLIHKKFPKIRLIRNKENNYFAGSVNQGIGLTSANYIFITNDDVRFHPQSIQQLVTYFETHTAIGVIGGSIYSRKHPQQLVNAGFKIQTNTGNIISITDNTSTSPDWIQGCALLTKKEILMEIGLMDTAFAHFFEDIDICFRIRNRGYKIITFRPSIFYHEDSTTSNKNLPWKYYAWYQGKIRFYFKHFSLTQCINFLIVQLFFITPYRAIVLRDGRFLPFIKALFWNILNIHSTLKARYEIQKNSY